MTPRRMRFWGWGYADEAVSADEVGPVVSHITSRLGAMDVKPAAAPRLEDIEFGRATGFDAGFAGGDMFNREF